MLKKGRQQDQTGQVQRNGRIGNGSTSYRRRMKWLGVMTSLDTNQLAKQAHSTRRYPHIKQEDVNVRPGVD